MSRSEYEVKVGVVDCPRCKFPNSVAILKGYASDTTRAHCFSCGAPFRVFFGENGRVRAWSEPLDFIHKQELLLERTLDMKPTLPHGSRRIAKLGSLELWSKRPIRSEAERVALRHSIAIVVSAFFASAALVIVMLRDVFF